MVPIMPRQVGARVSFPKTALLRHQNRSGLGIRPQIRGIVAHTALGVEQKRRGDDALIVDETTGLPIRAILPLARILLHEFVGDFETHLILAYLDADSVATGEIPRVGDGS